MGLPLYEPGLDADLTGQYWRGFQEQELRLPYCRDCENNHWYPLRLCPHCYSSAIGWRAVSGHGIIYTWVEVDYHFNLPFFEDEVPFYAGLVVPEENDGIRIPAILDFVITEPEIGTEVAVEFRRSADGLDYPVFRPVDP